MGESSSSASPPGVAVLLQRPGFVGVPFGVIHDWEGADGVEGGWWPIKVVDVEGGEAGKLAAGALGEGAPEPGGELGWSDGDKVDGGGEILERRA